MNYCSVFGEGTTTTSSTNSHTEEYPQSLPREGRMRDSQGRMTTRLLQRTLTGEVAVVKCGKYDKICKNLRGMRIH
ncbi:hypothetical protein DPMN_151981 [Dreissena polymorpha]|uniref:Uncharacterized protein n=1 Tax=Dreissena polymorpha TaxID=45954 RepID=A0A9D4J7X0_DREPO|nr:hypothetical protein DPMN_151981 [Dreissena polymorpha]